MGGQLKKLGLIVNPVAGMGGRVGLKGTDGPAILEQARELGAVPEAPGRAVEALGRLLRLKDTFNLVTYPHDMGENEARRAGFVPTVIGLIEPGRTTGEDTRRAAGDLMDRGVDLLLFAGGDGTARDICTAVGAGLVAVGVPAGVKIHSAVCATTPRSAGDLAALFLEGKVTRVREAEVMDIDEEAFRAGRVSARLYGYLKVPHEAGMVQSLKAGSRGGEESALDGIASEVIDRMEDGRLYVVGPGTTTRAILERLGLPKTLLGVDVAQGGRLVAGDTTESVLLSLLESGPARIVVTPIGGQGFIFGRGNQQISPRVIRKAGVDSIIVVATMGKLVALGGNPLLVDTGASDLNGDLSGYVRVITGYRQEVACKVASYT
ncbi:MAG: ATP-NAD kinase family protein [bacterium]|nr:ATP-NAD kinase family protein [bacterium]